MPTERLTWRNKPILRITDSNIPHIKIQFGLNKARLIMENLKAIEQFVGDCEIEELKKNAQEQTDCVGNSAQSER